MRELLSARWAIGLVVLFCVEIASRLCSAQMTECLYPFNLSKRDPAAYAALRKIVPTQFRKDDWIYKLGGVADEVTTVSVGPERAGELYLFGSVCKPHDCARNNFAFLVEYYGSRAVGLLVTETDAPRQTIEIGSPTAIELTLLRAKIAQW